MTRARIALISAIFLLILQLQNGSCATSRKSEGPPKACSDKENLKQRERSARRHLDYGRSKSGSEAIKHFSMAINCSKNGIPEAHYLRALYLDSTGMRSKQAFEDLSIACFSAPQASTYAGEACMSLGVWSANSGDAFLSKKAFSVAVMRDITNERAWSNYGGVYSSHICIDFCLCAMLHHAWRTCADTTMANHGLMAQLCLCVHVCVCICVCVCCK
jgi:hypothetical protein